MAPAPRRRRLLPPAATRFGVGNLRLRRRRQHRATFAPSKAPPTRPRRRWGLGPAFGESRREEQGRQRSLALFYQGKERLEAREDLPAYDEESLDFALGSLRRREPSTQRALAPDELLRSPLLPAPLQQPWPRPPAPAPFPGAGAGAVPLAAGDYHRSGAGSYVAREQRRRLLGRLAAEGLLSPGAWRWPFHWQPRRRSYW